MAQTYLTIQEASKMADKSIQTLRRAIKSKKVKSRRRKTPQGFNYMIEKDSIIDAYDLKKIFDKQMKAKKTKSKKLATAPRNAGNESANYITTNDLGLFKETVKDIIKEHSKDKENFFRLIKNFQDRLVVLESQVKLLEKPSKKWYQLWK